MRFLAALGPVLLLTFALPVAGQSEAPPCPTGLAGYPPETGGVFMSWTLRSSTDVIVYRDSGDGTFEPLERLDFPATRYIDHDTEPGETHRYQVRAVTDEGVESEACSTLEVTTVPFFPGAAGGFVAALVGVLGYAWVRRRG